MNFKQIEQQIKQIGQTFPIIKVYFWKGERPNRRLEELVEFEYPYCFTKHGHLRAYIHWWFIKHKTDGTVIEMEGRN